MSTNEIRSTNLGCASSGRFRLVRRLFVGGNPVSRILSNTPKTSVAFSTRRRRRVAVRHDVKNKTNIASHSEVQAKFFTNRRIWVTEYRIDVASTIRLFDPEVDLRGVPGGHGYSRSAREPQPAGDRYGRTPRNVDIVVRGKSSQRTTAVYASWWWWWWWWWSRPVSRSRFSPSPADSVLSRRQPTHIG